MDLLLGRQVIMVYIILLLRNGSSSTVETEVVERWERSYPQASLARPLLLSQIEENQPRFRDIQDALALSRAIDLSDEEDEERFNHDSHHRVRRGGIWTKISKGIQRIKNHVRRTHRNLQKLLKGPNTSKGSSSSSNSGWSSGSGQKQTQTHGSGSSNGWSSGSGQKQTHGSGSSNGWSSGSGQKQTQTRPQSQGPYGWGRSQPSYSRPGY